MSNSLHSKDYGLLVQLLRHLRLSLGITQAQLAVRLGKTQVYVSKCERRERRLDVMELIEFCEALEVDPLDLIGHFLGKRSANRPPPSSDSRDETAPWAPCTKDNQPTPDCPH